MSPKPLLFCFLCISPFVHGLCQRNDTIQGETSLSQIPFLWIKENIPKSRFWGNAWYTALAIHYDQRFALSGEVGRNYGTLTMTPAAFNVRLISWGFTYTRPGIHQSIDQRLGTFAEWSNFFLPPFSLRADYYFNPMQGTHAIKPSVGFSLLVLDLMYGYTIALNDFHGTHGLSLRFKFYPGSKNWQRNYVEFQDRTE
jgi:hypothetical protein